MSINISISVPTGFALNESGAITSTGGGGVKINGAEQNVSPVDTSVIEKRLDTIEQSIENKMNETEKKYIDLITCYERLENSNIVFNTNLLNELYDTKSLNKQHVEQYATQYNELKEYTNNLENRLKLLEEYVKKIEQSLTKKVEEVVVEEVVDPETIDIVSESDDVPDNITDASTEIAEEEKEDVVEEIEHIDKEKTEEEEVVEEAEAEAEAEAEEEAEAEAEEEEEEEEGMAVEEFEYKGKPYYRDDDNFVYEMSEEGELSDALGVWNTATEKIRFYAKK